jgi:hypothetical protein
MWKARIQRHNLLSAGLHMCHHNLLLLSMSAPTALSVQCDLQLDSNAYCLKTCAAAGGSTATTAVLSITSSVHYTTLLFYQSPPQPPLTPRRRILPRLLDPAEHRPWSTMFMVHRTLEMTTGQRAVLLQQAATVHSSFCYAAYRLDLPKETVTMTIVINLEEE